MVDIKAIQSRLVDANLLVNKLESKLEQEKQFQLQLAEKQRLCEEYKENLDLLIRASIILGDIADETTRNALARITSIINSALAVLYPKDNITINIRKKIYREVYTQFELELNDNDKKRSFDNCGTGLSQVISFLELLCFVDARGGRRLLVLDEALSGVHGDAKRIIRDLIHTVSDRFQFIMVTYDMDIESEYVVARNNGTATVTKYPNNTYYADVAERNAVQTA